MTALRRARRGADVFARWTSGLLAVGSLLSGCPLPEPDALVRRPPTAAAKTVSLAAPGLQALCDGAQIGFLSADGPGEFVQVIVLGLEGLEGLAGEMHVLTGPGPADDQVVVGERLSSSAVCRKVAARAATSS